MTTAGSSRDSADSERGATLVELLMAVVVMGLAFVIITGGIGTAIIGADIQRQQTAAGVALRSAAERIVDIAYVECATASDYASQLSAVEGVTVTVAAVSYWYPPNPSDPANPGNRFDVPCAADTGLQLVDLSATPATGRLTSNETLQVVKRRP